MAINQFVDAISFARFVFNRKASFPYFKGKPFFEYSKKSVNKTIDNYMWCVSGHSKILLVKPFDAVERMHICGLLSSVL